MDKLSSKFKNFSSALIRLREACDEFPKTGSSAVRDGAIKRFEFTSELAWKSTREYLLEQGYTDINSPKATMKIAFVSHLIEDEMGWLELLNSRNIISHVYDEAEADRIYGEIVGKYISLFEQLIKNLSKD